MRTMDKLLGGRQRPSHGRLNFGVSAQTGTDDSGGSASHVALAGRPGGDAGEGASRELAASESDEVADVIAVRIG